MHSTEIQVLADKHDKSHAFVKTLDRRQSDTVDEQGKLRALLPQPMTAHA
jgi:hypothetical protein